MAAVPEAALTTCVATWPSRSTRLPRMLDRIVAEPYDTEAWAFVLQETAQQPQPEHFRPIFGRFVALFPTAAGGWRQYIEAELRVGQLNAAENLFGDCLVQCPELELWRCYLRFVQNNKQASRVEVLQAHELLLEQVGADIDAGPLWSEYIALLCEDAEDHSAQSGQVQEVRRVYHKALSQPVARLEVLYQEYETWENGINPATAKQSAQDIQDKYNVARRVATERRRLRGAAQLYALARPLRGTASEGAQLMAWRKLWQYEASNPQRLSVAFLQARIEFTFNQALLPLRYVPQTWHEAASAMQALGHVDKARDYWTRGGEVLPESDALHLALARFEEAQARPTEARQVLEALVSRRPTPLNFILLMRFSFRAEGLKEARKVFTRGRKAESCTWHVYAAAADMEHLLGSGNEGALVAQRIYALGADKFPTEVPFLLKYLQFLLARPDLTNVRAVLERALQAVQGRPALELWNFYLEVENRYGELEAAQKVEARRAAAFPELPTGSLYSLVAQHAQLGLWPAEPLALEWMREAHMAPKRSQALAPPNFSLYVEYTGLDGDSAASAPPPGPAPTALAPAAGGPQAAPALPMLSQPLLPAFAGFIAALPPAGAYMGPAPAPADVEELFERLAQLPDSIELLPPMLAMYDDAKSLGGGGGGGANSRKRVGGGATGAVPMGGEGMANHRPSSDIYADRHKVQKGA